jgi:uncharacterized Tic20 family protein
MEKLAFAIGVTFYAIGSAVFIGITISFFAMHMYLTTAASRVSFIVIFAAMFYAMQGLIAVLVTKGGEAHRRQENYLLNQMKALYSHGAPGASAPD